MSKLVNALIMLPVVIIAMFVCELTIGNVIDQIGFAATSIESSRPAWSTAALDMFPQIHFATLLIGITWIVYAVLCGISDAAYNREMR